MSDGLRCCDFPHTRVSQQMGFAGTVNNSLSLHEVMRIIIESALRQKAARNLLHQRSSGFTNWQLSTQTISDTKPLMRSLHSLVVDQTSPLLHGSDDVILNASFSRCDGSRSPLNASARYHSTKGAVLLLTTYTDTRAATGKYVQMPRGAKPDTICTAEIEMHFEDWSTATL